MMDTLPKGWTIAKLDDVIIRMTNGANAVQYKEPVGLPISRIETISNETIDLSRVKYIKETDVDFVEKYKLRNGDILFSHINSDSHLGKTALFNLENRITLIHGINLLLLRPSPKILPEIINYQIKYLRALGKFSLIAQKAVNQSSINQAKLKAFEIFVPPINEQKRILAKLEQLLTDLDKGIEYLETTKQQLKVYRQAVLKWAFEGKLTNEKNIRWGFLKEVIEGVEYGSAAKSKKQGKVPVLRMGNIQNGRFEWDDLVYTDNDEEIKKYLLKKNDVLFNRTNSPEWVGKTAIYKGEQPAIFAGYLIRINSKENSLDPNYLNYFLNSQIAKNHGNKVKSFGVNQSNINGTKLKQYPFPICGLDSQKAIVKEIESRLSVCDKIEETIESSLQQAEALRLSIIKKAFEGKLVPQDPNDEPAEKLLERIRALRQSSAKLTSRAQGKQGNGKPEKKEKVKTHVWQET